MSREAFSAIAPDVACWASVVAAVLSALYVCLLAPWRLPASAESSESDSRSRRLKILSLLLALVASVGQIGSCLPKWFGSGYYEWADLAVATAAVIQVVATVLGLAVIPAGLRFIRGLLTAILTAASIALALALYTLVLMVASGQQSVKMTHYQGDKPKDARLCGYTQGYVPCYEAYAWRLAGPGARIDARFRLSPDLQLHNWKSSVHHPHGECDRSKIAWTIWLDDAELDSGIARPGQTSGFQKRIRQASDLRIHAERIDTEDCSSVIWLSK